ncbi:MAG TPA: NDP-sugar synthase [Candidatus Hydrogenedentes bacterium]|nr:NDP-sugar synthase [Candidatus Hydrogenedentota bacterium]HPG65215.1 NDP-sugar synthase [Candidatus Hydrogenedentota bacterium]
MKTAVILAAGEGSRAWPYCGIRQKVTLPVVNVPMVRRLTLDLMAEGIDRIVAVVGHRAEAVRACLGDIGCVRFVDQGVPKGPVDAALAGLGAVEDSEVLVCCGDIVTSRCTLGRIVRGFSERHSAALLLTAETPPGLTSSSIAVQVGADGTVLGIWARGGSEHPRFAGIAAAQTELLRRYLLRDPGMMLGVGVGDMPPPEGNLAYPFELMRKDGIEVHAVQAQDFLVDVDKPWHVLEANAKAARHAIDALDGIVLDKGAAIDDGADIPGDARAALGPGARIGKGCHIDGSLIVGPNTQIVNGAILGAGSILGADVRCEDYCHVGEGSVLGDHSIVSHCAEFRGVTFERVYLYHYCCVTGLVGRNVDIGAATVCGTWRFDDGVKTQNIAGHRELPECFGSATYLGDFCRTGVNAIFMPGVKIGYYSCVGGGAIVYDDVPERTMVLPKQELVHKPWGPEKLGW